MRARHEVMGFVGTLWLLGTACGGEHRGISRLLAPLGAGGSCGSVYLEGVADSFRLVADLDTPGATTDIVFEMFIPGSIVIGGTDNVILLTREIVITLPAAFGFQGFDALGAGAQIGQWDFDFSAPNNGVFDPFGNPSDYRIPHYAQSANQAYADTFLNGVYDAGIDSIATHTLGGGGEHVFTIILPSGGTNNNGAGGNCSYFDTDTRFVLPPGIVRLPAAAGSYDVTIVATSVDPDTGDDDDGQGTAPSVYQRSVPLTVPEPGGAAAAIAAVGALAGLRRRRRSGRRASVVG